MSGHLEFIPLREKLSLRGEPTLHPPKQSAGGVLSKRVASFVRPDGGVGMTKHRRRQKNQGSRGEFDNSPEIPKNYVTPFRGVVIADGGDRTPAGWEVEIIDVFARGNLRTQVKGRRSENVVGKVHL